MNLQEKEFLWFQLGRCLGALECGYEPSVKVATQIRDELKVTLSPPYKPVYFNAYPPTEENDSRHAT